MVEALAQSDRSKSFDRASKYYWGKQYEHLKPWTEPDTPLREKKPSVRIRTTKQTIDTFNSYLFGEGKTPIFKIESADGVDVSDDNLDAINLTLQSSIAASGLSSRYSELGRLCALNGTVGLAFHHFEGGRLDTEVLRLDDAYPTFGYNDRTKAIENDIDFDDLLELDEYWRTFKIDPDTGDQKEMRHRRKWELQRTVEYFPIDMSEVDLSEDSKNKIEWIEDKARTTDHELGFVPVEWIKLLEVTNDIDGPPLLDEDEFQLEDEINYTMSQTGRAIRYASEPTTVFIDVDNIGTNQGVKIGSQNTLSARSAPNGDKSASVQMLELSGTGQDSAMKYVDKLRKSIHDVARIVIHNPEQMAGVLSGMALKLMLAPMVSLVKDVRPQFGNRIGRLLSKMLRAMGEQDQFVTAIWPDVIEWTPVDILQIIAAIQTAIDAELITRRTAISKLAPYFGIDDIAKYMEELEGEVLTAGTTEVEDE